MPENHFLLSKRLEDTLHVHTSSHNEVLLYEIYETIILELYIYKKILSKQFSSQSDDLLQLMFVGLRVQLYISY